MDLNRPEEAGREWEKLLANPFVQKDDFLRFNCVSYMGPHYYQPLGRFEEAISIIQEGIDYFRHHDCMGRFGYFLFFLGIVRHEMGHFEESRKLLKESADEMRKGGHLLFLYIVHSAIALNAFYLKDLEGTQAALREAEEALSQMRGRRFWRLYYLYAARALLAFARGDREAFERDAGQALRFTEEHDEYRERYQAICWLAPYYARLGEAGYAQGLLRESIEKTHNLGATYGEARSHLLLSSLALDQQKLDLARSHLQEALTLGLRHRYDFLFLRKEREHAVKLLPFALKEKMELPWVSQLLGRVGEEAAGAVLPLLRAESPEVRAAAARALSEMGCREAERELVPLLKDSDPHVRESASAALLRIRSLPPRALQVYTLGRFRLFQGDREVREGSWRRKKAKALFKYLLFHPHRAIPAEELMDLFWPEMDPKQAKEGLHQAVSCLRTALEPGLPPKKESSYLRAREGSYQLLLPEGSWVDALAFEELLSEAEKRGESYQAISGYESALKLYQGDLLEEGLYEEWTTLLREKYAALYLKALRALSAHYFGRLEYDRCLETLQRLLRRETWDEEAHLLRMKCHLARGDRARAIQAYQRCCQILHQELDISPKKEIIDLYLALTGKQKR